MGVELATILGTVGIIASTTGGVIGGAVESHKAARQQAQAAEDNARMQIQQMEYNQRQEEREAKAVEAVTAENVRRQREESARLRSAQIAMLGKSGAALNSGSPLAILGATAANEELKIQDAHYSGARQAAAHYQKATDYGFGAAIARQNLKAAKKAAPSSASLVAGITGEVGSGLFQLGSLGLSAASAGVDFSKIKSTIIG